MNKTKIKQRTGLPERIPAHSQNHALSMLRQWAERDTFVELVDPILGLCYPGRLLETSTVPLSFRFAGTKGLSFDLLPASETAVASDGLTVVDLHSKGDLKFGVREDQFRRVSGDQIDAASAQMEHWFLEKTMLCFRVVQPFCAFAFLARVAAKEGSWVAQSETGILVFRLTDVLCAFDTKDSAELRLLDTSTGTRLSVSARHPEHTGLSAGFPVSSGLIH